MMTWVGEFDVYLVGMIKIPALIAENKALYPSFVSIHLASSVLLLTLSLIHTGAGLYHGYVIKDRYHVWTRHGTARSPRLTVDKFRSFFCFLALNALVSGGLALIGAGRILK